MSKKKIITRMKKRLKKRIKIIFDFYLRSTLNRFIIKKINYKWKPRAIISSKDYKAHVYESEIIVIKEEGHSKLKKYKIYNLINGRVDTDNRMSDCFLTSENELLSDVTFSYSLNGPATCDNNNIYYRYSKKPKKINGGVFSLLSGGGAQKNYYHWLFDALSRLKILKESGYLDLVDYYLLPNYSQAYKVDSFNFLNIDENKILNSIDFPHIIADAVIVAEHPNRIPVEKWISDYLRNIFLGNSLLPIINVAATPDKIFVSRRKATTRRITNEDEVEKYLTDKGFKTVFLEDLSFKEQVLLFNNAGIIISVHGASLANLLFCKRNTEVVEIFPPNSNSDIYKNLANNIPLIYSSVFAKNNKYDLDKNNLHADFFVDINCITKLFGPS